MPVLSDLAIARIAAKWLKQCGPHDAGLPMACNCPEDDPRPNIAALVEDVEHYRRVVAHVADLADRLDNEGAPALFGPGGDYDGDDITTALRRILEGDAK